MAQPMSGRVEVGNGDSLVQVRVGGRANHLIAQPLREFGNEMMRRGYREFRIDLQDCLYIDSTFAGVLSGLALKLKDLGGTVTLLRSPDRCTELLMTLGVDPLFAFDESPLPPLAPDAPMRLLPMAARSREAWASTILEAHRLLAQAEGANDRRFEDVVEMLRNDLPRNRENKGRFRN
jgi:anti-anti-sigma regulatory factor